MRASLPFLFAIALAGQTAPCFAQATPGPQEKSDDALSPSTLPKARQDATETSHIDALSPDEARRIERARAKAAAKAQPPSSRPAAEVQPAATQPAPPKGSAPTRADSEPRSPHVPDRDASTPSATPTETVKASAPSKEPAPKEAATPASQMTHDAHVADAPGKEGRPHAVRHAARSLRAVPPRAVATVEPRRFRQRPDWPMRRPPGELAERAPRVGDVVPPDVPLLPLPRGYGPHGNYPPFPRARDQAEDDYPPPPRRVFMEPY